ncbi:flagellar filament capping protein FliD [bacterium]|nr:flagellar filament capping protein FliD [bacterium]
MTISFSGLASGLDTDTWVSQLVSIKQISVTNLENEKSKLQETSSTVTKLQMSFNSLRNSLEKITDAKLGTYYDLFQSKQATTTDENIFTATVSNSAVSSKYSIVVSQLATNTVAYPKDRIANYIDDDTTLSSLGVTKGNLLVYINGVKNEIEVEDGDTFADIKEKFQNIGVNCDINENGQIVLNADDNELAMGTTSDESNFASVFGFEKIRDENDVITTYKSANSVYKVNLNSKLTESGLFAGGDITAGTFTIGNRKYSVTEETTLKSLINAINADTNSAVSASWNAKEGKLYLTSKIEGESYINIERGSSNVTNIFGFTSGDGAESSLMNIKSQNLGKNAEIIIDGDKTVISTTNTVTSEISGLTGVTLNLKGVSKKDDETGNPHAEDLTVEFDSTKLVDAVNDFIESYNDVMSQLDKATSYGGGLFGDTSISSIKRSIRNAVMSNFESGGSYSLLSSVGIRTAEIGTKDDSDFTSLTLDEDKFKEVLNEDMDNVKKLLIGEKGDSGLLGSTETLIENAVASDGYFINKLETFEKQLSDYDSRITTVKERVSAYKSKLESQFASMEKAISAMQSSFSTLNNYLAQASNNS